MIDCRLKFQTVEIDDRLDIHVRSLRDRQQFDAQDGRAEALGISSAMWPNFGVLWASGRELARRMAELELRDQRILELGCGLGLASLVLNARGANITAMDRHPAAGEMLDFNVELNGGRPIPFLLANWSDFDPALSPFDLIIGSDVLYMPGHAEAVSGFIARHAKPTCETMIIDPGRTQGGRYNRCMRSHGFSSQPPPDPPGERATPAGIRVLCHDRHEG